jgi:hypothetical protein
VHPENGLFYRLSFFHPFFPLRVSGEEIGKQDEGKHHEGIEVPWIAGQEKEA